MKRTLLIAFTLQLITFSAYCQKTPAEMLVKENLHGIVQALADRTQGVPEEVRNLNADSLMVFPQLRIAYYSSGQMLFTESYYVPVGKDEQRLFFTSVTFDSKQWSITGVGAVPLTREVQRIFDERGPSFPVHTLVRVPDFHGEFLLAGEGDYEKLYPTIPTRNYIAEHYGLRYTELSTDDLRRLMRQ
jgi:hypothetical protein